jgi:uncharacterized membrane protein YfhO
VLPRIFGPARISFDSETVNTVVFRAFVAAGSPALVATSLTDDGGWTAHDESGRRIATRRAEGPFLAFLLPPGEHGVVLRYVSPGFREGALLSVATLCAAAIALAVSRRRRAA